MKGKEGEHTQGKECIRFGENHEDSEESYQCRRDESVGSSDTLPS